MVLIAERARILNLEPGLKSPLRGKTKAKNWRAAAVAATTKENRENNNGHKQRKKDNSQSKAPVLVRWLLNLSLRSLLTPMSWNIL